MTDNSALYLPVDTLLAHAASIPVATLQALLAEAAPLEQETPTPSDVQEAAEGTPTPALTAVPDEPPRHRNGYRRGDRVANRRRLGLLSPREFCRTYFGSAGSTTIHAVFDYLIAYGMVEPRPAGADHETISRRYQVSAEGEARLMDFGGTVNIREDGAHLLAETLRQAGVGAA